VTEQEVELTANQVYLGMMMINNNLWHVGRMANESFSNNDFQSDSDKLVFSAIKDLAEQKVPFDIITVAERLEESGDLDRIGGLAYLGSLVKGLKKDSTLQSVTERLRCVANDEKVYITQRKTVSGYSLNIGFSTEDGMRDFNSALLELLKK
jgi:replicative DNA helicase